MNNTLAWDVVQKLLIDASIETFYMVFLGSLLAVLVGSPIGLALYITDKDSLHENTAIYRALDLIVNVVRSVPFVIFMILLIPLTEIMIGTSIGPTAALISLALSAAPFFARMLETSMKDVDSGVIEAAQAMGSSNSQIVFKVLIPEAMPSIINNITMLIITLIGYTAMAGTLGAGGLGAIAVRYGYYRREGTVLYLSVLLIIVLVQVIQLIGNGLSRHINKKL